MSTLKARIDAIHQLGEFLREEEAVREDLVERASNENPWFEPEFVRHRLETLCNDYLRGDKIVSWLANYDKDLLNLEKTLNVGLIMAGNIPLVGFHDFLCAYLCGYKVQCKLSSKDQSLMKALLSVLANYDSTVKESVTFAERLSGFHAVIATGSANTNRYFEYYFRHVPNLLRSNRCSVAVLLGDETAEELNKLAIDIFLYFGLGCRSVSKLFVPENYDVTQLFDHFEQYAWLHNHTKYMNNYDYNRTLLLLNQTPHLANEFIMLTENDSFHSPLSTLHYEEYKESGEVMNKLTEKSDCLQCVVGNYDYIGQTVAFGRSQRPSLNDYADNADTMSFLLRLTENQE